MSKIARIQDNQVVTLGDFQNLAHLPRDMHDALVTTAIDAGKSYSGATVTKTATTTVTVAAPAFLYKDGALYSGSADPVAVDLLSVLPTAGNKRIVAMLLQAQEVNTDTQARDFEVDGSVYPPVMDPQATETITWRKANITYQVSDQAPSPVKPVVDAANTVIAWVTLTSTEVSSVEQNTDNRMNTLRTLDGRVVSLENWRAITQPVVDGLRSDVAKLVEASRGKTDRTFLGYMLEQLARINERVGIDAGASFSKTDYFLDTDDSDTDHINYVAKVEEGLRFADDNSDRSVLALETPGNTAFTVHGNGILLPKSGEDTVLSVVGKDSEIAMSNAGSQTIDYVLKTISRTRIRYGNSFLVCTNSQWWQTGRYDPVKGIFERDGETFEATFAEQHPSGNPNHSIKRLRKMWVDSYEEPYWAAVVTAASYTGNVNANSFQMPRSAWVTKIRIGLSRVDSGGDIRLLLCETRPDGSPDYDKALAAVTVAQADLKAYPEMTAFSVGPVYLEGGRRYAWATITAGNHWLAMVEGNKYAQGTFFTSTDGVWSQGNIAQDACFEVVVADFEAPRLVVNLNDWNLSGGVTDIDLDLEQIVPDGATITYEVQIEGDWYPVDFVASGNHPLYGLPASVNARMVLLGTTELMPGVKIGASYRRLSRPRTDTTHISEARTAPANVDEVHLTAVLEGFDNTPHDCTATLLVGGTFDTEETADSVSDQVLPDGSVRRTWVFTGLAPTTQWKRKIVLGTTSALSIFHVAELTDVAFPAA
ncbi:MAG: hypothetical protein H6884_09810 [Rhodobiaceae bacterium]|nr:hypothetical protein [Rhodobiaceae bacterium]MCC0054342.1 hypothetical protein [Rhodobiaceae bacterium]